MHATIYLDLLASDRNDYGNDVIFDAIKIALSTMICT